MAYVDGFLLPVPTKKMPQYLKMARVAGKVWRDHGALDYKECAGDDMDVKLGLPFPSALKTRPDETIVFSYIVYKSRAHRDQVNKKVMADPRMNMDANPDMPFDMKRMCYGGFKVIVDMKK